MLPAPPDGISLNEVIKFVWSRLNAADYKSPEEPETPILGACGYVQFEANHMRLPVISQTGPEWLYDPVAINRWFHDNMERHGTGLASHTLDPYLIQKALRLLEAHEVFYDRKPSQLLVRAGYEPLPNLLLQVDNFLVRIPSIVTGTVEWERVVPYDEFARRVGHARYPSTISYDLDSRSLVIAMKSLQYKIPAAPDENNTNLMYDFEFPTGDELLGTVVQRADVITQQVLDGVSRIRVGVRIEHAGDMSAAYESTAAFLQSPCHITFVPGKTRATGSIIVQFGAKSWQFRAHVYRSWEGDMPLEYAALMGMREFYGRPLFHLTSRGVLTIANVFWSYMVAVTSGQPAAPLDLTPWFGG